MMKQFNVRDETHALGRQLSYETGKSLIVVVQEAMELYEKSLGEAKVEDTDEMVTRLLSEAASVIVERLCVVIPGVLREEATKAIDGAVGKLYEERAKESEKQAQLLRKSEDLPVVPYEEAYPGPDVGMGPDAYMGPDADIDVDADSGEA